MHNAISHDLALENMKKIPEWDLNSTSISRAFEFDEYMSAIEFVNTVAEIAEEAHHHPDYFYCLYDGHYWPLNYSRG